MASIAPSLQTYVDLRNGTTIGIHIVDLVSSSDTITVARLANTTSNASSAQLRANGENSVTVTDDGSSTVTIVGTAGERATIVTVHGSASLNFGDES